MASDFELSLPNEPIGVSCRGVSRTSAFGIGGPNRQPRNGSAANWQVSHDKRSHFKLLSLNCGTDFISLIQFHNQSKKYFAKAGFFANHCRTIERAGPTQVRQRT